MHFERCWDVLLSYLSRSLADCWGTTVDFTTSFLHSLRFSAFRSSIFHSRPVHSLMLSSHRFLCLPLRLPPWTVPCRIILASPDDRVTCPYHLSLRFFFTEVRSSNGPMGRQHQRVDWPWMEYTTNTHGNQRTTAMPPVFLHSWSSLFALGVLLLPFLIRLRPGLICPCSESSSVSALLTWRTVDRSWCLRCHPIRPSNLSDSLIKALIAPRKETGRRQVADVPPSPSPYPSPPPPPPNCSPQSGTIGL